MKKIARIGLALSLGAALLSAPGCGGSSSLTQVLVSVDTDIAFPSTIDEIRATIRSPAGETRVASAVLGFGQPALPRTIAVTHGGSELAGYEMDIDGLFRGVVVVSRRVVFDMTHDELRHLAVSLDDACIDVDCATGTTCSAGACVAPRIETTVTSGAPTGDAGMTPMDAGI